MGRILAAAGVLIATAAAFAAVEINSSAPSDRATRANRDRTVVARQPDAYRVYAQGRVEGATAETNLRPVVVGRIEEVLVVEGQTIRAGEPILRLESAHRRRAVQLAEADVEVAAAKLQRALNGPTEFERAELESLHDAKVAERDHQRELVERFTQLATAQAISQQEADDHRARLATLTAEASAAKSRLERLGSEPRADDVAIARANLHAAEAQLELARSELRRTELASPINGQVLHVEAEAGEIAGPDSAVPAVVVADISHTRIRAYVDELDALRVATGMPAIVKVDGLPDRQFAGKIVQLSPRMGPKVIWADRPTERRDAKTREVIVELEESTDALVIGLRVDLFIDAAHP